MFLEIWFRLFFKTKVHHHGCYELKGEDRYLFTSEYFEDSLDDAQINHLKSRNATER